MTRARSAASSHPSPVRPDAAPDGHAALTGTSAREREWLLTDGASGYGCGTAADLVTRRYHGLWVARADGSARRQMVVAGLDERVLPPRRLGGSEPAAREVVHLMHAHWAGQPTPSRPQAEVAFARRPLPTWTFETALGTVERTVALQRLHGEQRPALLVRWRNRSTQKLRLVVRPLLGWCDADHLPPVDKGFDATVHARGASWGVRPNDALPTLWTTADGVAAFGGEPTWYRNFHYEVDRVRGYDHVGHRYSPGVLEIDLPAGATVVVSFAQHEPCEEPAARFADVLAAAEAELAAVQEHDTPCVARLALGADDFLYRDDAGRLGVLAGFPWFGEWGRDVFLALPGLTLARGRADLCADVLTGCLPFLRDGLLPNVYGASVRTSRYNSCDAALWFALAATRYADARPADALVDRLVPALRGIVEAYVRGTELGLVVADDGLLCAGRDDLNATWMDAETSQGPVTPRAGLPVEIQALWYSLLTFLCERDSDGRDLGELRDRCGKAFKRRFWLAGEQRLADCVREDLVDAKLRPNMLVAAALSRSPLSVAQRRAVAAAAEQHLVTPCGLRTLSPDDPQYIGVYGGGLEGRDRAYHQGTVWPWLLGFHVEAVLRSTAKTKRRARAAELRAGLEQLLERELERAGIDHVSEVFDGDAPHRPGGTFAQAWNTGELLRAHALCRAAEAARELV